MNVIKNISNINIYRNQLKYKRLLGIDFGTSRVGLAISDALHISTAPLETLLYKKENFWGDLLAIIDKYNIGGIVVGIPINEQKQGQETETYQKLIENLTNFIDKLHSKISIPIFVQDESFSSKKAVNTMIEIGKKKKYRSNKGSTDKIAAAIILQDFINYFE